MKTLKVILFYVINLFLADDTATNKIMGRWYSKEANEWLYKYTGKLTNMSGEVDLIHIYRKK